MIILKLKAKGYKLQIRNIFRTGVTQFESRVGSQDPDPPAGGQDDDFCVSPVEFRY